MTDFISVICFISENAQDLSLYINIRMRKREIGARLALCLK